MKRHEYLKQLPHGLYSLWFAMAHLLHFAAQLHVNFAFYDLRNI